MTDSTSAAVPEPTATTTAAKKPRRPWRDNLEAFGVAILAAVLLKPMVIEAYQIPTSSMQPTLMGSVEAGVYDRILVDKLRYEIFEPKRWDIGVFRYPIRRNQNYVKRIVGVGGDRLRIAGGNVWQVGDDGAIASVLRKPDRIQAGLWKQVFPLRREIEQLRGGKPPVLGQFFVNRVGTWKEEDDGARLTAKPSSSGGARLVYFDPGRGLSNQLYDGYPDYIGAAIQPEAGPHTGQEGVQDLRFSFALTPESVPQEVTLEIQLRPAGRLATKLQLHVSGGQGTLRILSSDKVVAEGESFPVSLAAGAATHLAFAQLDDRLQGWVDGDAVPELEVGEHRVTRALGKDQVSLLVDVRGGGGLSLEDIEVERDLHYVPHGLDNDLDNLVPEGMERALMNHVIEVPEDHFFMMGDNTLASADSRQWEVVAMGVREDGTTVDPAAAAEDETVRIVKGNKRPWDLNTKPDVDENPVVVRKRGDVNAVADIAFTDDNGEVFALKSKLGPKYAPPDDLQFRDADGKLWQSPAEAVYFVPREHILGRPVLGFWPVFSPFRLGVIR